MSFEEAEMFGDIPEVSMVESCGNEYLNLPIYQCKHEEDEKENLNEHFYFDLLLTSEASKSKWVDSKVC